MRSPVLFFRILAVSLLAAGCTDRSPLGAPAGPQPAPPSALVAMSCTVSVRAGTLACGPAGAGPGASAAILGNQGESVRLRSTGMNYDGTGTFRMDVTVENLTGQALGTGDGGTPSADGVRVFLHSGPVATGGEGSVEVENADGEGIFMAPGQKYFQYDGILPPGDTSAAKEWRFTLPNTVTSFGFSVYVAAPVRAEAGWIAVRPVAPAVAVGDTQRVVATVRTPSGGVAGDAVAWTTSNPSVATVNGEGVVTGVSAGTATLTATGAGRTGSVRVLVHPPTSPALAPPTFLNVRVEGESVTSGQPAELVKVRLEYRGTGGFSPYISVIVRHATGLRFECRSHTNMGWVGDNREMWCETGFADGMVDGAWQIERVEFSGRTILHAELLAAGVPAYIHVHTPDVDRDGPTLDSLVIHTDTAGPGSGGFAMNVWTRDRMHTNRAHAYIRSAGNPVLLLAGEGLTPVDGRTPFQYRDGIPYYYHSGTFVLDSLRLFDLNGNRRTVTRAEMDARGFKTQFEVTGTQADTVGPEFTAFSISADSVAGNGADTVTVMLAAEETVDESGVRRLEVLFARTDDPTQQRRCLMNAPNRESYWYQEMHCGLAFGEGNVGTWRVSYVRAVDWMNNVSIAYTADMQAVGVPTDIVVTAP